MRAVFIKMQTHNHERPPLIHFQNKENEDEYTKKARNAFKTLYNQSVIKEDHKAMVKVASILKTQKNDARDHLAQVAKNIAAKPITSFFKFNPKDAISIKLKEYAKSQIDLFIAKEVNSLEVASQHVNKHLNVYSILFLMFFEQKHDSHNKRIKSLNALNLSKTSLEHTSSSHITYLRVLHSIFSMFVNEQKQLGREMQTFIAGTTEIEHLRQALAYLKQLSLSDREDFQSTCLKLIENAFTLFDNIYNWYVDHFMTNKMLYNTKTRKKKTSMGHFNAVSKLSNNDALHINEGKYLRQYLIKLHSIIKYLKRKVPGLKDASVKNIIECSKGFIHEIRNPPLFVMSPALCSLYHNNENQDFTDCVKYFDIGRVIAKNILDDEKLEFIDFFSSEDSSYDKEVIKIPERFSEDLRKLTKYFLRVYISFGQPKQKSRASVLIRNYINTSSHLVNSSRNKSN